MKTITFTEQELRDFATNCFELGVHGHRDPRTDEDMFEKLVETTIKGNDLKLNAGDRVKVIVTGQNCPNAVKHGDIGKVIRIDTTMPEEQVLLVQIGPEDDGWYFGLDGIMCAFEDCRIEKVTDQ